MSTLEDGATRKVGGVVVGTGATVGEMVVVKIRKRSVRAQSLSPPTMEKGAVGDGLYSALARFLAERVSTSTKEGAVMTHWCGKNCTILATCIGVSLWNINGITALLFGGSSKIPDLNSMRSPGAMSGGGFKDDHLGARRHKWSFVKSKAPLSWASEDRRGLIQEGRIRFNISVAYDKGQS